VATAVRQAAFAGTFYPADPDELRATVCQYLGAARQAGPHLAKAIIVPHAGYAYSGPIAGSGYARLAALHGTIERVVLLGPAHRVALEGLAVCSARAFHTPLGQVPVDERTVEQLLRYPQVSLRDDAHAHEHSLEVQLPFLQVSLGQFQLVPLALGRTSVAEVAEVLEASWGGPETAVIVSSDLSHYHDYAAAQQLDLATSLFIERLEPERLTGERACGYAGIGGLLVAARRHGLKATTVDLRNSGDTSGPRDRVVGYGSYVLC
jgi:AmmeMemoRadiSam system protein B